MRVTDSLATRKDEAVNSKIPAQYSQAAVLPSPKATCSPLQGVDSQSAASIAICCRLRSRSKLDLPVCYVESVRCVFSQARMVRARGCHAAATLFQAGCPIHQGIATAVPKVCAPSTVTNTATQIIALFAISMTLVMMTTMVMQLLLIVSASPSTTRNGQDQDNNDDHCCRHQQQRQQRGQLHQLQPSCDQQHQQRHQQQQGQQQQQQQQQQQEEEEEPNNNSNNSTSNENEK